MARLALACPGSAPETIAWLMVFVGAEARHELRAVGGHCGNTPKGMVQIHCSRADIDMRADGCTALQRSTRPESRESEFACKLAEGAGRAFSPFL